MFQLSDVSLLLIGYRRLENIKNILETATNAGISNFLISIDGPKFGSPDGISDFNQIKLFIDKFSKKPELNVTAYLRSENVGCAPAVLSSIDWAFEHSEAVLILEDDCLPSSEFFTFALQGFNYLERDEECWMLSGSQFSPISGRHQEAHLTRYSLIWGWGTIAPRWTEIRTEMRSLNLHYRKGVRRRSASETSFWKIGARGCQSRRADAWDSLLAAQMMFCEKYSLNSDQPLVRNIGIDRHSTNTHEISSLFFQEFGKFNSLPIHPRVNLESDKWLKKNIFKITIRHIFSNFLHNFMATLTRPNSEALNYAWESAKIN